MAPRRKRNTVVGQCLRAAREALHLGQRDLAAHVFVSARTVSRWENGEAPNEEQGARILALLRGRAPAQHDALGAALGYEMVEPAPVAPAPLPPAAPAVAPAPPERTELELRASLDAIVYAASEERDVLPRHLRAFGVELLQGVARLGLSAKDAAELVAVRERTKVAGERNEKSEKGERSEKNESSGSGV
jgi:transcriptional regulator with XRE-family HTH domain